MDGFKDDSEKINGIIVDRTTEESMIVMSENRCAGNLVCKKQYLFFINMVLLKLN